MNAAKVVLTIIGARPQFIKAASVSREIAKIKNLDEMIVHTGQHYDDNMSSVFFQELEIPSPKYNMNINGGSHGSMTGKMLEALEAVLLSEMPDAVLVYGDTNSTLAGALAASKLDIPVVHIEAGLRSFNRRMPEEVNRVITDHISELLFCPSIAAAVNLNKEGITSGVYHVGDVMFDASLHARDRSLGRAADLMRQLKIGAKEFVLCTVHRAENTGERTRLRQVVDFVEQSGQGWPIVWPVHPRTRAALESAAIVPAGINLIEPLGYFDMHGLLANCSLVVTDSGGLQKEAYFHRVPCVTVRDETEWVETLQSGWNRLWTQGDYMPRKEISDYGTGDAAGAIVKILDEFLSQRNCNKVKRRS